MANNDYLAFMNDPDQDSRRAELQDFFGPNAPVFLKTYDYLREAAIAKGQGKPKFKLFGAGFEPVAFFLGPVWFFYRKLWSWAWSILGLIILIAFIPGPIGSRIGMPLGIALGLSARRVYVDSTIRKLQKMAKEHRPLDQAAVVSAGGVSKRAGWISGIVFGFVYIFAIAGLIYAAMNGLPIPG